MSVQRKHEPAPSIMNSQRQPSMPRAIFKWSVMTPARRPEKAPYDPISKPSRPCIRSATHRNRRRRIVDRVPLRELMALVPRRQIERDTRRKARLDDAQAESHTRELLPVVHGAHARGDRTPAEAQDREAGGEREYVSNGERAKGDKDAQNRRPYTREDHVRRDLEDDIGYEKEQQADGVLRRREREVLLHPADLCVPDVRAVEVRERVQDPDGGDLEKK